MNEVQKIDTSTMELINSKIENIKTLIDVNDKNYDQRFNNVIKATQTALESADRAVSKAEMATDKRFESVNEFRQTLGDQASKFIIRTEFEVIVNRLEQDVKNLEVAKSQMLTFSSYELAHKDLQKQVDELRISRALLEGKASQESVNTVSNKALIGIMFGLISTVIAIINFISTFTR